MLRLLLQLLVVKPVVMASTVTSNADMVPVMMFFADVTSTLFRDGAHGFARHGVVVTRAAADVHLDGG